METNQLDGNWEEVKRQIKTKWGKLTDSDISAIGRERDQLQQKLQERYHYSQEEAKREVGVFTQACAATGRVDSSANGQRGAKPHANAVGSKASGDQDTKLQPRK